MPFYIFATILVGRGVNHFNNEQETNITMANAKKPSEVRTLRKKALHIKDRRYQPAYKPAMNSSFELGHSRVHDALSQREEHHLAAFFIIAIVAIILVALELTGVADTIRSYIN